MSTIFGKEVRVFLKGQAKEAFLELKKKQDKQSKMLVRAIERIIGILKDNPQFGNPIKKELIPKKMSDYGIKNLYIVELPSFWRMVYTIEGTQIEILVFILTIQDHKEYNKLFGYKAR